MGLDYSNGCVNFRDVGEFVNLIAKKHLLPEKKLLRGGKIDFITSITDIGGAKTIVNLRKSRDLVNGIEQFHFPISNDLE